MLTAILPLKRVDVDRLKSELIEAGVISWPEPMGEPIYVGNKLMALLVPDGSEIDTVRRVVLAHVDDRSTERYLNDLAKRLIDDKTPAGRRDRARDKLTVEAIQSLMAWCNGLRRKLIDAGLPITIPKLEVRTWQQLEDRVRELIDTESTEVKP